MFPSKSDMPMPPAPPPGGMPAPSGAPEGGVDPAQIKTLLIQAVQQVKKVCDQYGVDFEEIVESIGNMPPAPAGKAPAPGGSPPMPPPGAPPM